jgi:hypothetical protein
MSAFRTKVSELKEHLSHNSVPQCASQEIKIIKEPTKNNSIREELAVQQPIIIEKKTIVKTESEVKKRKNSEA